MGNEEEQEGRIEAVVGADWTDRDEAIEHWCDHLKAHLALPCEVRGGEDFRWEEFYILGPGNAEEYEELRKTQPSYRDVFELLMIDSESDSEWCLFYEDLAAHVRRKRDGREFTLGLSELEPTDQKSQNFQLLHDYAVWFVNSR